MSLFPAYCASKSSGNREAEREWLENKSFKPEYAELLQEHNSADRLRKENSSSESSPSDGDVSRAAAESAVHERKRKRKHSPDDDKEKGTKKKKEKKKKSKKKHKHKEKHRPRSPEKRQSELDKFSPKYLQKYHLKVVFMEDIPGLPIENAFREDYKADTSNWQYGELYKMHIAKYFPITRNILGSVLFLGKGKKLKNLSKSFGRYHSKDNRVSTNHSKDLVMDLSQFVKAKEKPIKFRQSDHREDFISIEKEKSEKVTTSGVYNPLGIYDKTTALYIQGKMPQVPEQEPGSQSMTSDWQKLQQRVAKYNKHLHENPGDIDMWLEFVDFQDEAVMLQEDQADNERQKRRDALVQEIKESVMAKALQKNPASLRLQLAQLRLCNLTWESAKLRKAWRQLTFHHPNNPCVWWLSLEHIRTTFTTFSVSSMCKAYARCIKSLWEVLSGTMLSHQPLPYTQQHILEIVLELVTILWQCGHMERASAICQALLEFNLNCPEVLQESTTAERMEFLEAFWDGSLPRVGEDDAQGWRHWVDTRGDDAHFGHMYSRVEEENLEEELLKQHTSTPHDAWQALEQSRSSRHWLPWHPDVAEGEGEDDCEDPERLVLFEDIKDFICAFSEPRQQLQILMTYLSLLGVGVDCDLPSNSQAYIKNMRTHLSSLNLVMEDTSIISGCKSSPLFPPLQIEVINNLFEQTVTKFQGSERSELMYLWLTWKLQEFKILTKDAGKKERKSKAKELKLFAKKLLSEYANRNDLRVWEAYAVVEWAVGNTEEGDKVMSSALSMTSFDLKAGHLVTTSCQALRLHRVYAVHISRNLKSEKEKNHLLHLLVTLAGNEKYKASKVSQTVSSVQLLKAKRGFKMGLDCLLSGETLTAVPSWEISRRGCLLEHWTICYALFEYLTTDLPAACTVFEQVILKLEGEKSSDIQFLTNHLSGYDTKATFQACLKERLIVASVTLTHHHVSSTISPLHVVRNPLMDALFALPDSLPLLRVFMDTESSANILGQMRRRLLPVAKMANTALPWIIAVLGELKRQHRLDLQQREALIGLSLDPDSMQWHKNTINSLRSWIERAVSTPAASNSLLLWRLFMFLEKEYGNTENVKAVFYRSIQKCPWAKCLYVDFAVYCPNHLDEVCDLLTEKELRLRTPLEELQLLYKGATTLQAMDQEAAISSDDAVAVTADPAPENSDSNVQESKDARVPIPIPLTDNSAEHNSELVEPVKDNQTQAENQEKSSDRALESTS